MRPYWLVLLCLPTALGFASVPPNTPHGDITKEAAEWAGWPDGGIDALVVAVHDPDYEQIDWEPRTDAPARYDLSPEYDAAHHCDRVPPTDNATAFQRTRDLLDQLRQVIRDAAEAQALVDAAGAALHALQDCFSHSDYVDLSPADQERFVAFLFGDGAAPAVRLVASAPDIEDPGMPPDPYPHDRYAKDSPGFNNESKTRVGDKTKFEWAKAAATNVSARFLNETLEVVSADMREDIDALEPEAPEGSPIPGPGVAALLGAVAILGAARGRRTRRPLGSSGAVRTRALRVDPRLPK